MAISPVSKLANIALLKLTERAKSMEGVRLMGLVRLDTSDRKLSRCAFFVEKCIPFTNNAL